MEVWCTLLPGARQYMKEQHLGLLPEIIGNNWSEHLPHRHEYTCTEQVTVHIKQILTEQFTYCVCVLRDELLGPDWWSSAI